MSWLNMGALQNLKTLSNFSSNICNGVKYPPVDEEFLFSQHTHCIGYYQFKKFYASLLKNDISLFLLVEARSHVYL